MSRIVSACVIATAVLIVFGCEQRPAQQNRGGAPMQQDTALQRDTAQRPDTVIPDTTRDTTLRRMGNSPNRK